MTALLRNLNPIAIAAMLLIYGATFAAIWRL